MKATLCLSHPALSRACRAEQHSKAIMDFNSSVVADESQFAEFVHKKTDAGSGGADHRCQCLLADTWIDRLRTAFLSEMREQKEKACETLLARIEQLVDQVFFNSAVAAPPAPGRSSA
jgi:hypothetical protein